MGTGGICNGQNMKNVLRNVKKSVDEKEREDQKWIVVGH